MRWITILSFLVLSACGSSVEKPAELPRVIKTEKLNLIISSSSIYHRFTPLTYVYEVSDGVNKWKLQSGVKYSIGDEVEITIKPRKK